MASETGASCLSSAWGALPHPPLPKHQSLRPAEVSKFPGGLDPEDSTDLTLDSLASYTPGLPPCLHFFVGLSCLPG